MIDNETLQAIGELIEKKLEPIQTELKTIQTELKTVKTKQSITNRKLEDLSFEVKTIEHTMKKEFHKIHDAQDTLIAVIEINGMLPKIN